MRIQIQGFDDQYSKKFKAEKITVLVLKTAIYLARPP
jgi:hypothetical protein